MSAAPGHPSEIKEWIRLSPDEDEREEGKVGMGEGEGMGWDEQLGKEAGRRNRIKQRYQVRVCKAGSRW